ncbi:SAM-dependent methyltransferase [Paenibacillus sp. FSL H8-0332]|uniref:23S rRNA (Cytidine1920-2'-O)/16S rRNA (Cytidine1409-2'-O)-methyltransferase n=2 Tax=Paenibacillus silagei TaxID=1670801 RepID=A0ABS4NP39_9BACL|nr:23S rRNA (cytidine1920-2'-O)/16S rRNA (cytidine1409-2'-O)-methyltransferase [Paenibacillus silagei]
MKKNKKSCTVIDKLISENWFDSFEEAKKWIILGRVLVNDELIISVNDKVPVDGTVRIKRYYQRKYVNKGGLKLAGALSDFGIDVNGKVVMDCGASTGGFTDCLIQNGAKLVYAVDVGYGQLAGKLLFDKKIVNMEKTNLADKVLLSLFPSPEVITLDLSYLSLKYALPLCREIIGDCGTVIALIKPLFEVASSDIRRSGEFDSIDTIRDILTDLCNHFIEDYEIIGITNSQVTGNNGTLEFFIYLEWGNNNQKNINSDYSYSVDAAINRASELDCFSKHSF